MSNITEEVLEIISLIDQEVMHDPREIQDALKDIVGDTTDSMKQSVQGIAVERCKVFPEYDISISEYEVEVSSFDECLVASFDNPSDFAEGVNFVLNLIDNHWTKVGK